MSLINSKLLLFGEYTIIQKSDALALPLSIFGGKLRLSPSETSSSNESLRLLYNYIATHDSLKNRFALDKLICDIEQGLQFESNIPQGYGLGSSGAVCAAIYNSYCTEQATSTNELKFLLAMMECCWHGKSSGLDPLVCCLQKPIHIVGGDVINMVELPLWDCGAHTVFLLDTLQARQTTPLVALFVDKCQHDDFVKNGLQPLAAANGNVISHYLQSESAGVWREVDIISRLEWEFFREMIPSEYAEIWKMGLDTDKFRIKLCGAGGGGFLLGFARDWDLVRDSYLYGFKTIPIGRW